MSDPRDTYAPRLTGREKLPHLADLHTGDLMRDSRDTSRRDAWIIAIGVALLCALGVAALILADPIGKAAADAVRAESITFPKGY